MIAGESPINFYLIRRLQLAWFFLSYFYAPLDAFYYRQFSASFLNYNSREATKLLKQGI